MDKQKIAVLLAFALGNVLSSVPLHAQGEAPAKSVTPAELKWSDNPALPKGVKYALVAGDPKQGAFVSRIRVPANVKIMPHSHASENQVTVLSGTVLFGEGDKFDAKKLKAYPAGSFIVEKANSPHFMSAKGPAVFQVSVPGKTSFDYVDPKDDPRKK